MLGREGGARRGRMARPSLFRGAPGRLRGTRLRVKRFREFYQCEMRTGLMFRGCDAHT